MNTDKIIKRRMNGIKMRCNNKKSLSYKYYGGKGIRVLISESELKFLWERDNAADMKKPSIDRINPDGNYEISNCRFIELSENTLRTCGKIFVNEKKLADLVNAVKYESRMTWLEISNAVGTQSNSTHLWRRGSVKALHKNHYEKLIGLAKSLNLSIEIK